MGSRTKEGTLTVTHSLVWQNTSTNPNGGGDSGGIQNYGDDTVGAGTLHIDNSTVADNTAALGGGIFRVWWDRGACSSTGATSTTTMTNSTIADNNGGSRSYYRRRTAGHRRHDLGGELDRCINTVTNPLQAGRRQQRRRIEPGVSPRRLQLRHRTDCGFKSTGDLQNTDPQFLTGGLAFNGGNTATFALKATSSAIDSGPDAVTGCSATDQRDVARPQGTRCDSGAYELFEPVEGIPFTDGRRPSRCRRRDDQLG